MAVFQSSEIEPWRRILMFENPACALPRNHAFDCGKLNMWAQGR
jgi:hypothetical protein